MKNTGKPILFGAMGIIVLVLMPMTSQAVTAAFTGAGGNTLWHNPANWSAGEVPGTTQADVVAFTDNITVDFNAATWAYLSANSLLTGGASGEYRGATRFLAGDGFGTETQVVNFDYGDANTMRYTGANRMTLGSRNGQTSRLNILSGTTIFESAPFDIGDSAGSSGTLNVSGGHFVIGRNAINVGDAGSALVNITGGRFTTRAALTLGSLGTFHVSGTAATEIGIGSYSSVDGAWSQSGLLSIGIDDTATGVTKIFIDDYNDDGAGAQGNVTFLSGALLDVDFAGAFTNQGTFTVMEWEGTLTDNGLAFAPGVDTNFWSFELVDTDAFNGVDTLQVTYFDPTFNPTPDYINPTGGKWETPENWMSGIVPSGSDEVTIAGSASGQPVVMDAASWTYLSNNSLLHSSTEYRVSKLLLGGDQTASLDINIGAGNTMKATSGGTYYVGSASGSDGTLNVLSGNCVLEASILRIAQSAGSAGRINIIGADASYTAARADGGGTSLSVGTGGDGTFYISDGSFNSRMGVTVAASGTFEVAGSAVDEIGIGSYGSMDGNWQQHAGGTLRVGIDLGLAGLTKIFVDDYLDDGGAYATFAAGSLLDVDYYNGGYGGGTWTVLEVENGDITDNGLAFAPGVDTGIWSFNIDNSGANGKLTVTATGDPAPPQFDVSMTVDDTRRQMMRYGLDYERLWSWNSLAVSMSDEIAEWSVNDCNIDYIRCAINSKYELEETNFVNSAYTSKIIPMMTAMQEANPHIKWFASPRPLNEAYSGGQWNGEDVTWQPYPIWITGASTPTNSNFNFNDIKCSEYLIRYLLLMKSHGFKITYLDITNEWQSDNYGGRVTQFDVRDIVAEFQDYLTNPWEHPEIPGVVLDADDIPLIVGPSSWNYQQGGNWIDSLDTQAKKDAIDIASSHNTDRTGTASDFAATVAAYCNPGTEVWETEQHGWKSTSGENEVTSFYYYIQSIRAGFTGLNSWLAIGKASQGHCFLLNESGASEVVRNVKYYIFKKLSTTSNYGYALDIDEFSSDSTMALIRDNLLTVWINNTAPTSIVAAVNIGNHVLGGTDIQYTRWNESLPVEGVEDTLTAYSSSNFYSTIEAESLYCFEITLLDNEDNFPFVQAENYATGSGVAILPCIDTGGGDMVAFASAGDEVLFNLDIVKTYPHDVAFRVSSESANIAFEVYDGTNLLASVNRVATGGAQNWTTIYETLHFDGGPMELRIVATGGGWNLNWIAFDQQFYSPTGMEPGSDPLVDLMNIDDSSLTLSWSGVEGGTYALQHSTNLVNGFSTVESGIPVHSATNMNTLATPDDEGFYRIIVE